MEKKEGRIRRSRRTRARIKEVRAHRLSVHRTPRHIYAQIITPDGERTVASASTLDDTITGALKNSGNIEAAKAVGAAVAERAKAAGIVTVAFDRSGFQYHGRVKALADAARENGLKF